MPDGQPTIIVFESQPFWEPELRRQFDGDVVTIAACRSVPDLDRLTTDEGEVIAVVNLADAPAELLRWLARRLKTGRQVPTIALLGKGLGSIEWHAREAGATAVVSEYISGRQLARLCRRQWDFPIARVV